MPTLLYHLRERVPCDLDADDIVVGHPVFPYKPGTIGVTELTMEGRPRPRLFALITPLHCNTDVQTSHINRDFLYAVDRLVPKADLLFAIQGQYWWDRWDTSPFAHWKPKMVRLDMAVDVKFFPRVKKRFNPPGKRGYLYIGRNDPVKGISLLRALREELSTFPWGWIGGGPEIPGIHRIARWRELTSQFMREMAQRYDFFVNTSVADANPTTILESMAWGFPVLCTLQSGYYETSYIKNIYADDVRRSTDVLTRLQHAEEDELMQIADKARSAVEKEYNWKRFTDTVLGTIDRALSEKT